MTNNKLCFFHCQRCSRGFNSYDPSMAYCSSKCSGLHEYEKIHGIRKTEKYLKKNVVNKSARKQISESDRWLSKVEQVKKPSKSSKNIRFLHTYKPRMIYRGSVMRG